MSELPEYHLPPEATLTVVDGRVCLTYPGDLRLSGTFGGTLASVEVTGDLTVDIEEMDGNLKAGGHIEVLGPLRADLVHGKTVRIASGEVHCRAVSADERVDVGPIEIRIDGLIAPIVTLERESTGRVTVLECHNKPDTMQLKGAFSLDDYEEAFGNAEGFLAERSLTRPGPIPEGVVLPAPKPRQSAAPSTASSARKSGPAIEWTPLPPPRLDERDQRIKKAYRKIMETYADTTPPADLTRMGAIIEQRDYPALREQINVVWEAMIAHHQKQGVRPHHSVANAFNVIHGLVQQ
jgi:hypothetical protein